MAGTTIGTAWINVVPSFKGTAKRLSAEIGGASDSVSRTSSQKMATQFSRGFAKIGKVGAAAFAAVGAAATVGLGAAVKRVDTMNNFPKVMANLGYSSKEAAESIKKMSEKLQGLPTSLDSMAAVTQRLAPLTGSLSKATDLSLALNNAFLASGASAADVARATEQYSQMLAKGSVDLQSWRTLQEVMPGQLDQLAKALLGPTANSQALYEAMKSGKVSFDQFNDAIIRLNEEGVEGFASFSQQAIDATKGIATAWANVRTAMVRGKATIIQAIGADEVSALINKLGAGISKAANSIATFIEKVKEADGPSKTLEDRLKGLAFGAGLLAVAVKAGAGFEGFSDGLDRISQAAKKINAGGDDLTVAAEGFIGKLAVAKSKITQALSTDGLSEAFSGFATRMRTMFNTSLREAAVVDGDPLAGGAAKIAEGIRGLTPKWLAAPFGSMRSQINTLLNSELREAAMLDGDPLAGAVVKMRSGAEKMVEPFKTIGGKITGHIQSGIGRVKATTPVASLGSIFSGVGDIMAPPFEGAMGKIGDLVMGFFKPGNFLKFFGIGAIAAGLVAGLGAMASEAGGAMLNEFAAQLGRLPGELVAIIQQLATNVPQFMQIGMDLIMNLVTGLTQALPQIVTGAVSIITGLVSALAQNLPQLIPAAVQMILTLVQALIANIPQIIQAGLQLLVGLVQGVINALPQLIAAIPQIITVFINAVLTSLPQIITTGIQLLNALINGIIECLPQLVAMLPRIIDTTVTVLLNNLPAIIDAGIKLLVALIDGIMRCLPQLIAMAPQIIERLVVTLANNFPRLIDAGFKALRSLITGVVNALPQLWQTASTIPGNIVRALGNVGRLLWNAGRSIITGLWNGMVSMFQHVWNGLASFTNSLLKWKGPPKKDKVLLYGAGQLIIGGFKRGLESQYGAVHRSLAGFTADLEVAGSMRPRVDAAFGDSPWDAGPRPIQVVQNISHAEMPKTSRLASAGAAQARLQASMAAAM